jgi:hypothetical protein
MNAAVTAAMLTLLGRGVAVEAAKPQPPAVCQPRLDHEGWEILFDGKGLAAWDADEHPGVWKINEQGEVYPAKPGAYLNTKRRYCDFRLELEFKMGARHKANSGVFLRMHDVHNPVGTGREVQILDNTDYKVPFDALNANGALYDLVRPAVDANRPIGQWNQFRITADGSLVVVELNGKEIVRADLDRWTVAGKNPDGSHNKYPYAIGALPREGFIGLQNYGGAPVWFRNIRIKPLGDRRPQLTGKEPIKDVLRKIGSDWQSR